METPEIKSDFESRPLRYLIPVELPISTPALLPSPRPLVSMYRNLIPGETVVEDLGYWDTDDKGHPHFVPVFCVETEAGAQAFSVYVSRETFNRWLHAPDDAPDLGLPIEYPNPDNLRRHLAHQAVNGAIQWQIATAELWRLRGPEASLKTEAKLLQAIATLSVDTRQSGDMQSYEWALLAEYLGFEKGVLH